MKKLIQIALFLLFPSVCMAWDHSNHIQTGSLGNKITIRYVAVGYSDPPSAGFVTEATNNTTKLWENNFFAAYQQRFDVDYISDVGYTTKALAETAISANDGVWSATQTTAIIHVVIDYNGGSELSPETDCNAVVIGPTAEGYHTLAHEIGQHILGWQNSCYGSPPAIATMKDTYAAMCAGITTAELLANIVDTSSTMKWSDLETGTPVGCGSYYTSTDNTTTEGTQYQNYDNIGYKMLQIGLAKRTADNLEYTPLGTDFSAAHLHYGQDTTAPTATVEGIQGSHTYYGPTNIRVYATDAGTGIDRVEFWLSTDGGAYSLKSVDRSDPYTWQMDLNSYTDGTFSVRIYVFDEAQNYYGGSGVLQYDSIEYTHYERIGEGCTTAYFIDRDCDGYGVGQDYLTGMDADDKNILYNTTASVEAIAGVGDLDGVVTHGETACTGTECATNLKAWLDLRTDRAYPGKADVFYVSSDGGAGTVNTLSAPFHSIGKYDDANSAVAAGAASNDIIVMLDGTHLTEHANGGHWYLGYNSNYTVDNELIVIGMPGKKPILKLGLDGNIINYSSYEHSYIIFDSLIFDGLDDWIDGGNGFSGSGMKLDHITYRNLEMKRLKHFFYEHGEIYNQTWEYVITHTGYSTEHPIYESCGGTSPNAYICDGNKMLGCIVYDTYRALYQLNGPAVQFGSGTNAYWNDLLVDKCIFHTLPDRALSFENNHLGTTVQNSIFFNVSNTDIQYYNYNAVATLDEPKIINNTFYRGSTSPVLSGSEDPSTGYSVEISWITGGGIYTINSGIIRNNVWHRMDGTPGFIMVTQSGNIADWLIDHNVFYRESGTAIASIDGVVKDSTTFEAYSGVSENNYTNPNLDHVADGYYDDPWSFNLDLTSNSTICHNAGSTDSDPSDDIHGATRGLIPDIGADEYSFDIGSPSATGCTISGGTFR